MVQQVLETNKNIYELIVVVSASIPAQVQQQSVYFVDADGRSAPFHLEFINSAEAFISVLLIRLKGRGELKIKRGEFVLEHAYSKQDIDLGQDWTSCFHPGQRVNIDMCFIQGESMQDLNHELNSCPGCGFEGMASADRAVDW